MEFSILMGSLVIGEAETPSRHQAYETFTMTVNPDGGRTLRAVSRSPRGDLLRDVNQMAGPDWRPIEGAGRVFYKGEWGGTVMRRVIDDRLFSYAWTRGTPTDIAEFAAPPGMTLGFHPMMHEAWKMNFVDPARSGRQPVLTFTMSNTWNGRTVGHGQLLESEAAYEGEEEVTVPAGTFTCQRFTWWPPFDKELHIWRTGPENVLVKELVAKGDKAGTLYQLATLSREDVIPT